jgi:hypothetical protein
MITVSKDDLSEEEFETIIQSRGFQKMLLYQRLADGIEILRTHDRLYESLVRAITDRHSEIESADMTREVLDLLEDEIGMYTEPLEATTDETTSSPHDVAVALDDVTTDDGTGEAEPENAVQQYLEERLEENDQIEIKANEIASVIGLHSTYVGGILGQWRQSEDAPFAISASESPGDGNIWTIERVAALE